MGGFYRDSLLIRKTFSLFTVATKYMEYSDTFSPGNILEAFIGELGWGGGEGRGRTLVITGHWRIRSFKITN